MNKIEELSQKKNKYEEEEKKYFAELKYLQDTKSYYEQKNANSNGRFSNIIETLDKSIEENKLKIQSISKSKKAVATIIKTIKGSNTKIANKINKIEVLNLEIEEIKNNINQLNSIQEKQKTDTQEVNNSEKEIQEKEIEKLNKLLEEKMNELKAAERIIKGAETARKNALLRYDESQKNSKAIVRKRKTATKVKIRKLKYKKIEPVESKEIVKTKIKVNIGKNKKEEQNSQDIKNSQEEQDLQEAQNSQDEEFKKMVTGKSVEEVLEIAEKEREKKLLEPGGMFSEAEYIYNKIIDASGMREEIDKIIQSESHIWSGELEYEPSVDKLTDTTKVTGDEFADSEESVIEETISTSELNQVTSEEITEIIKPDQEVLEDDTNIIETHQEVLDDVTETIKPDKKVFEQIKNQTKLNREIQTNNSKIEDVYSTSELEKLNNKTNSKNDANKQTIKKITLKEYSNYQDISVKHIYDEYEDNYEDEEQYRYIDIDGRKYEINRKIDKNTENEIDNVCKEILQIEGKPSILKRISMQRLKGKVDPAIVNALKESIMADLQKWNADIEKLNDLKKISYAMDLRTIDIREVAENARKEKAEAQKIYMELLEQYIESIEQQDENKRSFDITYDCSGEMSASQYNKIKSYINATEKSGGQVIGKRRFFGLFKEPVNMNETIENENKIPLKEGDTSFVERVPTNLQVIVERVKKQSNREQQKSNTTERIYKIVK